MGLPNCNDLREANPLKLGAQHVPFPCSLLELVLDRYAEPPGSGSNPHPMQLDELLQYLKNTDNFNLSPWVAIVGQTEAIGDPATPSREQVAILRWLGKALELWEKQFPLEGRLAAQVRRLKPLSAALAIVDPRFMQPGIHPLHQLLDNIQARAIGWQSRLDRAGVVLEQQVTKAVDQSRSWFDNHSIDLQGICAEFSAAAERDQARAQRMIQRVIETEAGKLKTAAAKQVGAQMINALLEKYPAPEEIGEFLKGPWYTSAQLLLLKFGTDSAHWQQMSITTETLLDSLQSMEDAQEARRQYIFDAVTQLPKEMRRWLLSLHHDTEAVNEAMGLVERAHLRILRKQPLELKRIAPIEAKDEQANSGETQKTIALKNWLEGQWLSVDSDEGVLRAQLVLKVEQSEQLVFANMAGIKVLQLSFQEFSRLLEQGRVKALSSGASFSLCLAYAVGIDSVEILDALVSALSETEFTSMPASELRPQLKPASSLQSASEAEAEAESGIEPEVEAQAEVDLEREKELKRNPEFKPEQAENALEQQYQRLLNQNQRELTADTVGVNRELELGKQGEDSDGFLVAQAEQIKARGGFSIAPPAGVEAEATPSADLEELSPTGVGSLMEGAAHLNGAVQAEQTEDSPTPERQITLPMGTWLGFHDGETPLMARLAVHDPEEGYYIFVNRNGVKMRQVSSQELNALIDNGLVEILETHSNFRSMVAQVRKELDQ